MEKNTEPPEKNKDDKKDPKIRALPLPPDLSGLEAAVIMHELYLDLCGGGFSQQEALILLANILKTKEQK